MFTETEYSVVDFASCISEALDLVSPELNDHHKRVAYIAYMLAQEMRLPDETVHDIFLAAILHDIGAFTDKERLAILAAQFHDTSCDGHQETGYRLLHGFAPFANAATLIKNHHTHYNTAADTIPVGCYVIHLADRIAVLLKKDREILAQVKDIVDRVERHRRIFHPDTLTAFGNLAKKEFFWIEACMLQMNVVLPERIRLPGLVSSMEAVEDLAKLISQLIDFRSRFTATHSSGVSAVARELAIISGFSERECRLVAIAGYLHDIGKLAISNEILEKNGMLDYEEHNEMRKHPYNTYLTLSKIKGFERIAEMAGYHHERLDGNGYPFHVKGENISRLTRIVAVADILTAITEDRPYREGMEIDKAMGILFKVAADGGIDEGIVQIVKEKFFRVNGARRAAQQVALERYNSFYGLGAEPEVAGA